MCTFGFGKKNANNVKPAQMTYENQNRTKSLQCFLKWIQQKKLENHFKTETPKTKTI